MIRLLIASAGAGKTHWLQSEQPDVLIDCTLRSHRAVLCAIADSMGLTYPARATMDDLIRLITSSRKTTIGLDNIDRTSRKIAYTIMALAYHHDVACTATSRDRIMPLVDRQAAIMIEPPVCDIPAMLRARYPTLSDADIRRIAQVATSPAAATHVAQATLAGMPVPSPPTVSAYPLVLVMIIGLVSYIRWQTDMPAYGVAMVAGIAYYLRRQLWRQI